MTRLLPISPRHDLCGSWDIVVGNPSAAKLAGQQMFSDEGAAGYWVFPMKTGYYTVSLRADMSLLSKRDSYFKSEELTRPQPDLDLMENPKVSEPVLGDGPEERKKLNDYS